MKKLLSVVLCSLAIISTTHSYALTFKSGEKKSFETEDASSSAQDLQLPETQFPISEDEHLVVVERGVTTLPQFKGQRIAWKDSVLTVRGFPGTMALYSDSKLGRDLETKSRTVQTLKLQGIVGRKLGQLMSSTILH